MNEGICVGLVSRKVKKASRHSLNIFEGDIPMDINPSLVYLNN